MAKKRSTWAVLIPVLVVLLAVILVFGPELVTAAPAAVLIDEVQITNVWATSFTVSWVTDQPTTGEVHYGPDPANLDQIAFDSRGETITDDTHYVVIQNLIPNTLYYFDAVSNGATDDNGGAHYAVMTGPTLDIPTSEVIYGQAFKEDGVTPAEGAIVYLTLFDDDGAGSPGQAAQMSSLADSDGYWHMNLGNTRTDDLVGYFDYSTDGDGLELTVQGAGDGSDQQVVSPIGDNPLPPVVLLPPSNTSPTANDDNFSLTEDSLDNTLDVLANDTDPDGDSLTISAVGVASNGTVVNNSSHLTYTPDANFHGPDVFTYTTSDGELTATATVTVTVNPVNDSPVANDDLFSVEEDSVDNLFDVLGNDTDLDGDPLVISLVGNPGHGTVVNQGSDLLYTPDPGFNGSDSFTYTLSDGELTDTAVVSVTVNLVNDPPIAEDDSFSVDEDSLDNVLDVLGNDTDPDGDPLTISTVSGTGQGTVVNQGSHLLYTPTQDYHGPDSFSYEICDTGEPSLCATAAVSITVNPVNDAPTVTVDEGSVTVDEGQTATNSGTFGDVDGDAVTLSASVGSIVGNEDGTWSWSFEAHDGPDESQTVTITADDGNGDLSQVTFALTVNNVAPEVTLTGSATANEGDTFSYSYTISDPGADTFSLDDETCGAAGSLANSTFDGATGLGSFDCTFPDGPATSVVSVTISDDDGGSDSASLEVTVNNVPPTANAGPDQTVFRNDLVAISGTWADPAGDLDEPYTWSWDLDGDATPDENGTAAYGEAIEETTSFGLEGSYTLSFAVTDKDGGAGSDSLVVEVLNRPPDCTQASPSIDTLWPPSHEFVAIEVLGVTDPEGDDLVIAIDSIFQDEPVDSTGDGSQVPDGQGIGTSTAAVRAERDGSGNGRVYHLSYTANDGHGGTCSGELLVGVPKSQGQKSDPVDDGPLYDSTVP